MSFLRVTDMKIDYMAGILNKYSSFVGFPVELNGARVNTVEPLWIQDPKSVTDGDHTNFYRFVPGLIKTR